MTNRNVSDSTVDRAFQEISRTHEIELADRGYTVEAQLNLDNFLVRNRPWKTYWRATHEKFGTVFVKVNYGYSEEVNRRMGYKEAALPQHLAGHFDGRAVVRFPRVIDSWQSTSGYFVVFAWEEMRKQSGFSVFLDQRLGPRFVEILRAWERIPKPKWWSDEYVLHDFGGHGTRDTPSESSAPFGFDLDDNLAVVGGDLMIYDLEFLQWSHPGLQTLYLAQKYLTESRKILMDVTRKRGCVSGMLRNLKGQVESETIGQAYSAHVEKLKRNGEYSLPRRVAAVIARKLIRHRV